MVCAIWNSRQNVGDMHLEFSFEIKVCWYRFTDKCKCKIWSWKKERTLPRKRRGIYKEGTCNIQKTRFWGENTVYGDIDCWQFVELYQRVDDLLEESYSEMVIIVGPRKKQLAKQSERNV